MKIGIIVDASVGIDKIEAEKRGWYFMPLLLTINNKDYLDGQDLNTDQFYKIFKDADNCKTAATPLGIAEEVIAKATKENDHVIIFPISKGISSQWSNLSAMTKDMKKVHIVESVTAGGSIDVMCSKIENLISKKYTIEQIMNSLATMNESFYGYIIPNNLKWLVKGGRISPAVAKMANLFKVVPIISANENGNGSMEKYGKGRIFKKTVINAINKLRAEFKEDYYLHIYHSNSSMITLLEKDILAKIDKITLLPGVITAHTGMEAICVLVYKK